VIHARCLYQRLASMTCAKWAAGNLSFPWAFPTRTSPPLAIAVESPPWRALDQQGRNPVESLFPVRTREAWIFRRPIDRRCTLTNRVPDVILTCSVCCSIFVPFFGRPLAVSRLKLDQHVPEYIIVEGATPYTLFTGAPRLPLRT